MLADPLAAAHHSGGILEDSGADSLKEGHCLFRMAIQRERLGRKHGIREGSVDGFAPVRDTQ